MHKSTSSVRTVTAGVLALIALGGCSTDGASGSAGASGSGGTSGSGAAGAGGASGSGAAGATGGASGSGGDSGAGGSGGSGAAGATGGLNGSGGAPPSDSGASDSAPPRPDAGPQPDALWIGDLETGDFSQYDVDATWNFEGTPVPAWPSLVSRASDAAHVRQGSFASRFHLESGQKRQELILPGNVDVSFGENEDLYFGYSIYVEESFNAAPSDWCAVLQWKNDGEGSPPLEGEIRNDGFHFTGGYGHPNGRHPTHDQIVPGGLVRSKWVDFVVHVVFSSNPSDGWYEVFKDGARVLPPFHPPGGTLYPGLGSYHKHGLYCDPAISGSRTVWHDAWRIGRSYDSVDPRWGR